MLHKGKVARAIYYGLRRKLRTGLGVKPRARPWPPGGIDVAVAHNSDLVNFFAKHVPSAWNFGGAIACEVGCGSCLGIASHLISRGCAHVDLIEPSRPILNSHQTVILRCMKQKGLDVDPSVLKETDGRVTFEPNKISYIEAFMESSGSKEKYDYILSFHVMEHVEDLASFYSACYAALKPGGRMFHRIDFSGHSEFEDPVPPLDYQTYPDWVFGLMYPKFDRTTRSFIPDHEKAITQAGFVLDERRVTWEAESGYMRQVWPLLRASAKRYNINDVAVLDAVLFCHKPSERNSFNGKRFQ